MVFDSAVAAFENIIHKLQTVGDIEMWAVVTDQNGYVSTEWLIYTYSRKSNQIIRHTEPSGKGAVREPKTPRQKATDISGVSWDELAEFDFSITY
jgi:hypothetical protein